MTAARVLPNETWPAPSSAFTLDVLDDDGEYGRIFAPGGPAEFDLVCGAPPERDRWVMAMTAPSREQGHRAGAVLSRAFAEVRQILSEPPPDRTNCEHDPEPMRFSRKGGQVLICRKCDADLGPATTEAAA